MASKRPATLSLAVLALTFGGAAAQAPPAAPPKPATPSGAPALDPQTQDRVRVEGAAGGTGNPRALGQKAEEAIEGSPNRIDLRPQRAQRSTHEEKEPPQTR